MSKRSVLASVLFVAACASAPQTPAPRAPSAGAAAFTWPTPEGWKQETIPFPLEFAPSLPHRGVEEIRFAPKFFDAAAPTFFSYAFVWWLEPPIAFDAARLGADLETYFAGLMEAVGKEPLAGAARATTARIAFGPPDTFVGEVRTVDAFTTKRPIALRVVGAIRRCGDHVAVIVRASPRPEADPIWADLDASTRTFVCR